VKTTPEKLSSFSAFLANRLVARGEVDSVLRACKAALDAGATETLLIFEDASGKQTEFDFTGSLEDVLAKASPEDKKVGPGRPKLGVVSREVSLLPRHWEWLEQDPHGISAALRRLVDEARKREPGKFERAQRRDAASKFMWCLAGNLPGFEEASRALFAEDRDGFFELVKDWPEDIEAQLRYLTEGFWPEKTE
jgi:hypothetical protein